MVSERCVKGYVEVFDEKMHRWVQTERKCDTDHFRNLELETSDWPVRFCPVCGKELDSVDQVNVWCENCKTVYRPYYMGLSICLEVLEGGQTESITEVPGMRPFQSKNNHEPGTD